MGLWFEEQETLSAQIRRTMHHHDALAKSHKATADLNEHQLLIHEQRIKLAKEEFENWKKDNNIEEETK